MVVCICNNVTEKDIKRAVRDGASSMTCLQQRLAVSTRCGQCHSSARACLEALVDTDISETLGATA